MLERLRPASPEAPVPKLVDTLLITGNTQDSGSHEPTLDHHSRVAALAAGLLLNAGLSDRIVMLSDAQGLALMRNYLDGIDIPHHALVEREKPDEGKNPLAEIERIAKDHDFGEIGVLSTDELDERLKDRLHQAGLKVDSISPEEVIGERIVESARSSRHAITELLKEAFLSIVRYQKMLENVRFTRIARQPAT